MPVVYHIRMPVDSSGLNALRYNKGKYIQVPIGLSDCHILYNGL